MQTSFPQVALVKRTTVAIPLAAPYCPRPEQHTPDSSDITLQLILRERCFGDLGQEHGVALKAYWLLVRRRMIELVDPVMPVLVRIACPGICYFVCPVGIVARSCHRRVDERVEL